MSDTIPTRWQDIPNAPRSNQFVCLVDDIPDGGAHMAAFGELPKPFRLLIIRHGNELLAYVNRCSHFGVPLAQKVEQLIMEPGKELVCNVHYSRFGWRDGRCLGGECNGEGLLPVPLHVDGQRITIGEPVAA